MIDLEISLVKLFSWSLRDIDETDIESLLPFVQRLAGENKPKNRTVYCDQVAWF